MLKKKKVKNQIFLMDYKSIKEKIIGMEFEVIPDIKEAVKSFVKEIGLEKEEEILTVKAVEILKSLNYNNLRSVRQAFVHISQILVVLKNDTLDEKYVANIVEYFLALFIQRANGEIASKDDFLYAIEAYSREHKSLKKYREIHQKDDYPLFVWGKQPLKNLYYDIIQKGNFSSKQINEDYKYWVTPKQEPAYIRIVQNWIELPDNEFRQLYKEAMLELKNGIFHYYAELLDFAYMELLLNNYKVSKKTCNEIEKEVLSYVKKHKSRLNHDENFYMTHSSDFEDEECKKCYRKIVEVLKNENFKNTKLSIKKEFSRILSSLPESLSELEENIRTSNNKSPFYKYAILDEISMRTFYFSLKKLSYTEQRQVYNSFCDRYGKAYSNGFLKKEYYPDVEKIRELAVFYRNGIKSVVMSPENKQKEFIALWYEELYEWMKKQTSGEIQCPNPS